MSIQSNINQIINTSAVAAGLADKILSDKFTSEISAADASINKETGTLNSEVVKRGIEEQATANAGEAVKKAEAEQASATLNQAIYHDKRTREGKAAVERLDQSQEDLVRARKAEHDARIRLRAQNDAVSQVEARLGQMTEFRQRLVDARSGGLIRKIRGIPKKGGNK